MADTADPFSALMSTVPGDSAASAAPTPTQAMSQDSDPFARLMATADAQSNIGAVHQWLNDYLSKYANGSEGTGTTALTVAKAKGYKPTVIDRALTALDNFTEQAGRAASFGLSDKVNAAVPAVNQFVAGELGFRQQNNEKESPFSAAYHNELLRQRAYGEQYAEDHPVLSPIATTAGTIGSLGVDGAAKLPATLLGKVGIGAGTGALIGGVSGYGNSNDESVGGALRDIAVGAGTGAFVGGTLPLAFEGARAGVNWMRGGGVEPETARLAEKAISQYGIPIRGGQISGSPFVKYTDSVLSQMPFSGYVGKDEVAHSAFTRAVSRTFGEDSPSLSQEVMNRAKNRLGKVFDSIASRTTIQADNKLLEDLSHIESDAAQVLPEGEMKPIKTQLDNLLSKVSPNDTIDGKTYQALTRKGAPLARAMASPDPNVKFYAGQIKDALDDALERSAPPEVSNDLIAARRQYKNMKTVEDLAEKAGPSGRISPALLLGQVRKSFPNYAYTGAGELGDLAQIGQRFLKEPPNSGTANRTLIHNLLKIGGGGEGALLLFDPAMSGKAALATAGATAGTAAAGYTLGKLLDNPLYRAALLRGAGGGGALSGVFANPALATAARGYVPAITGGFATRRNDLLNTPAWMPEERP